MFKIGGSCVGSFLVEDEGVFEMRVKQCSKLI